MSSASLRAVPGEIRALLGRSGMGKSTLLKIAAGIIPADTGIVRLNGETLSNPSLPNLVRRGVFYLPDHDFFSRKHTIGAQLEFFEQTFRRSTVAQAAKTARIEHLLNRQMKSLSGGELRRAELAAALARKPLCLFADEPFRGIAPVDHDALSEIFRVLASDGCAVVITGHEVPSLLDVANHVTWCTAGTTYELGSPATARETFAFRRDYLGPAHATRAIG
ncbi:MAG: ATP-binding cassette domain-containing protein [Gemmatimonadaceae bacterium]